jgi:hypothetical protein
MARTDKGRLDLSNDKLTSDTEIEQVELTSDTEIEIIKSYKDLLEGQIFTVSGNIATVLINKGLAKTI